MDTMQFVLQKFDIKKLRHGCNVRGCKKVPTKELLLLEFDRKRPAKRVVSLYLCDSHCTEQANRIPEELKDPGSGKHVGGRIYNINYITH